MIKAMGRAIGTPAQGGQISELFKFFLSGSQQEPQLHISSLICNE